MAVYLYATVVKDPRVCSTTEQGATQSKQQNEDQGVLRTGQRSHSVRLHAGHRIGLMAKLQ